MPEHVDRLTDDQKIALGWKGPLIERWARENGVPVVDVAMEVMAEEDLLGLPRPVTPEELAELEGP